MCVCVWMFVTRVLCTGQLRKATVLELLCLIYGMSKEHMNECKVSDVDAKGYACKLRTNKIATNLPIEKTTCNW